MNYVEISKLESMKKNPNGSKPRSCSLFRSQESFLKYTLYGFKLKTNGDITMVQGEEFRIVDLPNKTVAKIFPDSTFTYIDENLKQSKNPFNQPLKAIFTENSNILIINLKSAPDVGNPENQFGSTSFEKVDLEDFKQINDALTFYCR